MVPSGEAGEDGDEDEETDLTSMSSSSSSLSVDLATLGLGNEGEEDLSDSSDSYRPGFSLPDQGKDYILSRSNSFSRLSINTLQTIFGFGPMMDRKFNGLL